MHNHASSSPQRIPKAENFADGFVKPSEHYVVDPEDIWESADSNPTWLKQYFQWHKETLGSLNTTQSLQKQQEWWKRQRLLILECHETSAHCGGLADRLSAMPFLILLAARSQRLILIYWGRPAALEEFLLPPVGGMDWRIPKSMQSQILSNGRFASVQEDLVQLSKSRSVAILHCLFQAHDHGALYFNSQPQVSDGSFEQVTRGIWRVLFTPSPPVATRILQVLQKANLQPGKYVAAHLRALYAVETRDPEQVRYWTENAVRCASNLPTDSSSTMRQKSTPSILFAADNRAASLLAERYGIAQGVHVVRRKTKEEPLHLDKTLDWKDRDPRDFDDAFVDLYLLALANCVAYGMGGYGKFASFLSRNLTCGMQHHAAIGITPCEMATNVNNEENRIESSGVEVGATIFISPMPARKDGVTNVLSIA